MNRINHLSSLNEFLDIKKIKNKIESLDKENSKIENILSYLSSVGCSVNLASYYEESILESITYQYESKYIELPYEFDDIDIKNKKVKAIVTGSSYEDFFTEKASYLGNNKFSVTFRLETEAKLLFLCEEEDYELLPYKIRKILVSKKDIENNYIEYSGIFKAEYNGIIIVSGIDEGLSSNELDVHFSYLRSSKCEIVCKDSIESIVIQSFY